MRSAGQVLLDGAGAREAAPVEREDVGQRDRADGRQQHRQRRVEPGEHATAPDRNPAEKIGPIASDWPTTSSVPTDRRPS